MGLTTKRVICYIFGLMIMSLGVTLTIKANVGVGAWDALNVGLSKYAFTVGSWVIIIGVILIVINAVLMKRKPDLYAFFTIVIVGLYVDGWLFVFKSFQMDSLVFQVSLFLLGMCVLALGVTIYLQAKFAPNPVDNLMIALHTRFHMKLGLAKTVGEVIAFIFALLVKGPIGFGTIVITIFIGPIVQFFYPKVEGIIYKDN